jgi:hypothetical protein
MPKRFQIDKRLIKINGKIDKNKEGIKTAYFCLKVIKFWELSGTEKI